ncbi:MAG TPA: phosphate ABC transporter substrate-binding protein PstS [Bacteroidales bacterium]|nr:phosphate ABC transporter substrate-binding protein PstS [Bacteroidales bacterium]
MKAIKFNYGIIVLFLAASVFAGQKMKAQSDSKELLGAGATFPYPLYSKMFDVYHTEKGVKINYQSIGSGGGIKQLQNKTVDFGASDAPLSDTELGQMPSPVVHIPTCLGAVMITYNLPGDPKLKITADVIADIFLGNITKWNDARIKGLNPEVNLPDLAISVIHRSDGSGTTYVFSDYLSKVSTAWNTKPGKGKALDWPVGIGAKGNEGVGGMVKQTPGSIGYVELAYVMQNKMASAEIKNKSGVFVEASIKSISAAASVALPEDLRVSLTNTDAKDGYPISSFTYILVYVNQAYDNRTNDKAKETVSLVKWMITDGQKYAAPLIYAPLPKVAAEAAMKQLRKVNFNGKGII